MDERYLESRMSVSERDFILERVAENASGKLIISAFLVKKYREFTSDYGPSNKEIRFKIIDLYTEYLN